MASLRSAPSLVTRQSTIDSMSERIGTVPELRSAYRSGETTPAQQAERVLAGLAGRDGGPVWISTVPADELRARAAALTRHGDPTALPLYGIPFAVKDNIDVAGHAHHGRLPRLRRTGPPRTAPVVQRLLDAGALLVGKTNLDQFATGLTGTRSPYGAVRERLRRRPDLRRLQLRLGGRGRRRPGQLRPGYGHRRLRPGPGGAQRHRRPQAHPGPAQHRRGGAGLPLAGLRLGLHPRRRRRGRRAATLAGAARRPTPGAAAAGAPGGRRRRRRTLRLGRARPDDLDFFGDAGQADRSPPAWHGCAPRWSPRGTGPLGAFLEAGDLLYQGPWVAERLAAPGRLPGTHPDSVLAGHPGGPARPGAATTRSTRSGRQHRLRELRAAGRPAVGTDDRRAGAAHGRHHLHPRRDRRGPDRAQRRCSAATPSSPTCSTSPR